MIGGRGFRSLSTVYRTVELREEMNEVTERQGHRAEEILERQNRPREMEAGQEMRKARCERASAGCD